MKQPLALSTSFALLAALLPAQTSAPAHPTQIAICSPEKTNGPCTLTIDRDYVVAPLAVRLRPGTAATVTVIKRPTETIVFTADFKQTENPDPGLAILNALLPSFASFVGVKTVAAFPPKHSQTRSDAEAVLVRQGKLIQGLKEQATNVTKANALLTELLQRTTDFWKKNKDVFVTERTKVRDAIKSALPSPALEAAQVQSAINDVKKEFGDPAAFKDFPSDKDIVEIDIVELDFNQSFIVSGLTALAAVQPALEKADTALGAINSESPELFQQSRVYSPIAQAGSGTAGTITFAAMDSVTKVQTAALATFTINWSDSRWDLSTGTVFSALPNRTFQATQQVVNGQVQMTSSGQAISILTQSTTTPEVVPFFLAHFRLCEWLASGYRAALLLTAGIGINPYSKTAEPATGISFSYRSLVFSGLVHFGRDVRLTNGFYVGQTFVGSAPSLTTQQYWSPKLAFGISYRLPIN